MALRTSKVMLPLLGGFTLSFLALGVLWAGTPWPYQFLMFFPFLFLGFASARRGEHAALSIARALPFAALMLQFRDKNDSHLFPFLLVCSWIIGALLGNHLGKRAPPSS